MPLSWILVIIHLSLTLQASRQVTGNSACPTATAAAGVPASTSLFSLVILTAAAWWFRHGRCELGPGSSQSGLSAASARPTWCI